MQIMNKPFDSSDQTVSSEGASGVVPGSYSGSSVPPQSMDSVDLDTATKTEHIANNVRYPTFPIFMLFLFFKLNIDH